MISKHLILLNRKNTRVFVDIVGTVLVKEYYLINKCLHKDYASAILMGSIE